MTQNDPSLTGQAIKNGIIIALMVAPTAISIYVAIEVKAMGDIAITAYEKDAQIICFQADVCALKVRGTWYRVSGVIDMDETVPEEYRLQEVIDEVDDLPTNAY
jgi:hypothetical protein